MTTADAQAWMQGKVADLDGSRFEPEHVYWRPNGSAGPATP
jgi:hypothetical protein